MCQRNTQFKEQLGNSDIYCAHHDFVEPQERSRAIT